MYAARSGFCASGNPTGGFVFEWTMTRMNGEIRQRWLYPLNSGVNQIASVEFTRQRGPLDERRVGRGHRHQGGRGSAPGDTLKTQVGPREYLHTPDSGRPPLRASVDGNGTNYQTTKLGEKS